METDSPFADEFAVSAASPTAQRAPSAVVPLDTVPLDTVPLAATLERAACAHGMTWAQLHVDLFVDGLTAPGQEAHAAAQCRAYADQCPQDRDAWLAEAAWYEAGAPLSAPPLYRSTTPGRTVPNMAAVLPDRKLAAANDDMRWIEEPLDEEE